MISKYIVLRDNFTFDRFHYEGRVYELADEAAAKYPKNFQLVENPATTTEASERIDQTRIMGMEPPPTEPAVATPKYQCSVCGKVVRTALGLSGHSRSHKGEKNVST